MSEMLKVEGLTKRYGFFALDHVDLSVEQGCVTGLVGSNGAGKTTAIKAMLGLIRPDEGALFFSASSWALPKPGTRG